MAQLTWHEPKRQWTLENRGLDFADFPDLFEGDHVIAQDSRHDYGEVRYIVVGQLRGRLVVAAFVVRRGQYRIISMRKANAREKASFGKRLGQSEQK